MKNSKINLLWRAVIPVVIGVAVTLWLFYNEVHAGDFSGLKISGRMVAGFALSLVFVAGRDFGLTWRFHTIARPQLSWRRSLRVDLMCAFTSAITPSAMGGSAFAIFYLNREGVTVGRATTMTLTTLLLDELFFVVFCPIIILIIPFDQLFGSDAHDAAFIRSIELVFWLVYAGIIVWSAILYAGIIAKPQSVARILRHMFMWRPLRRWRRGAFATATNMLTAAAELRQRSVRWWLNVFFATVLSWFSRYMIVNALFWGFIPGTAPLLVFARQFVVWVLLMVAPTPGGSGISEWLFTEYYGDLIGDAALILLIAVAWRIVSYYIYLLGGSILLPSYFKKRTSTLNS